MKNRNDLLERLGMNVPIIAAPMAGGGTTPQLVAAVCNAGGFGVFAGGYLSPEQIARGIAETRALTDRPFGANLLLMEDHTPDPAQIDRAHRAMQSVRDELEIEALPVITRYAPSFDEAMEAIADARLPLFSFTFGILDERWIRELQAAGTLVAGTATTVAEAVALEKAGVDAVVAQGSDAGSHRGTFLGRPEDSLIGTMALAPQVVDAVDIPVIASGGIMDGRGIRAALSLGASAVQMGTAFLATPESGIAPAYKEALLAATEDSTVLTRAFSGKLARGLRNRFTEEMRPFEHDFPPYPIQNALTSDIRRAAAKQGRSEFLSLWAGQGVGLIQAKPAAELIAEWMREISA